MSEFGITASQTVGPFLKIGLAQGDQEYVVAENAKGALRIVVMFMTGKVSQFPMP